MHHELRGAAIAIAFPSYVRAQVKKKRIEGMTGRVKSADDKISKFREATGIAAGAVADCIFEGLARNRFWIFTHHNFHDALTARVDAMIGERTPVFELPV